MKNFLVAFAAKIALGFLQELAQTVWDALWGEVFEVIEQAEKQWVGSGRGELKKAWVVGRILFFIEERRKMNVVQKWAMKVFLSAVVDAIIKELNEQLGKDWKGQLAVVKDKLAAKIPFIN